LWTSQHFIIISPYDRPEGVFTMFSKEREQEIIRSYERDEQMMILIFAQWCVNHDLDPVELYRCAYPQQETNEALRQAVDLTVPKAEAGHIADEMLLNALSLYDNEELAFVVTEEIGRRKKSKR